ncbi:hypothetical protein BKI52_25340 [marine bacterium AO1-C]|nr:hypothetical protein BKI52_25340 [marine bacterium AO1-C]
MKSSENHTKKGIWYYSSTTIDIHASRTVFWILSFSSIVFYLSYLYLPYDETLLWPLAIVILWIFFQFRHRERSAPDRISFYKRGIKITQKGKTYRFYHTHMTAPSLKRTTITKLEYEHFAICLSFTIKDIHENFIAPPNNRLSIVFIIPPGLRVGQVEYSLDYRIPYPYFQLKDKDVFEHLIKLKKQIEEVSNQTTD